MRPLAIFLLPAVVGGGLGDIDEVLVAGATLQRAGYAVYLYRRPGRPLPREVSGPWRWPPHRRLHRLPPADSLALTVAPSWGVSAAPAREGPFGRPGPWAVEAEDIERRYGREHTLHVSLEEFARLFTSDEENRERYREGGWSMARIRAHRRGPRWADEVKRARFEYHRFRDFDRPNLLHLFGSFSPASRFQQEFPEAVQTGPLWPVPTKHPPIRREHRRTRPLVWCWYASPSSCAVIIDALVEGVARARRPVVIRLRTPRPIPFPRSPWVTWRLDPPTTPAVWRRRFRSADLRIVTGSRTLLEAVQDGGPWLYFNGVMGRGPSRRRHRPEKIDNLFERWPRGPGATALRRDLGDFARGRRVREVVEAFARDPDRFRALFRSGRRRLEVSAPQDQGRVLTEIARQWSAGNESSVAFVERVRRQLLDLTPRGA